MSDLAAEIVRMILADQKKRLAMEPGDPAEDFYMGKVNAALDILKLIPGGWDLLVREMARGSPFGKDDVMPA